MRFNLLSHIWCTYTENVGDNQRRAASIWVLTWCTYTENVGDNQLKLLLVDMESWCTYTENVGDNQPQMATTIYYNLKALCQRCHNQYDAEHRKQTRKGISAEKQ